tara:strand:+ start:8475 stop:9653 length:1179 start_codon:yes stop_codon:yes gene_type:complete
MKRIGVVCFEDIEAVGKAWASESGKEAKRISGIGELSSSVYWVTNLPYNFFRKYNLNKKPNVFDHQFFRTSVKLIAGEVGLEDDLKKLSEFCSKIFQRTFDSCESMYDIDLRYSPYRLNALLSDYVISKSVRQIPMGASSSTLMEAFMESTQQNQAMLGEVPKGSKARTFAFPKGAYARELLSKKYPVSTQWDMLNDIDIRTTIGSREGNMISGTKAALKKITKLCENKAGLFKISVLYTERFFRSFATFGQGSNYQRSWVTYPELMDIIQYNVIEIIEGYTSEIGDLPLHRDIDLDIDEFSYSRGLTLENIWTAYTLPLNRGKFFTPVGAYMRAYDRILCSKAAYEFSRNNLSVGSFGTGRVIVYCKKSEESLAAEIAMENGLIPPLFMIN